MRKFADFAETLTNCRKSIAGGAVGCFPSLMPIIAIELTDAQAATLDYFADRELRARKHQATIMLLDAIKTELDREAAADEARAAKLQQRGIAP